MNDQDLNQKIGRNVGHQEVGVALERVGTLTVGILEDVTSGDYDRVSDLLCERGKMIEAIGVSMQEAASALGNDPGKLAEWRTSGTEIKKKNDELLSLVVAKRSVLIRKLIDVQNAKAHKAYLSQGRNNGY